MKTVCMNTTNPLRKILAVSIALFSLACFSPLHAQDEAKRAAAEELLKAMHIDEMMANQKETMKKMADAFMPKDLSAEELKVAQEIQAKTMETVSQQLSWEVLKPDFIQAYSQVYTEQELKDLTAFYQTPVGQKFIEKMPELQARTMEIIQKRMATIMPAMLTAMKDAAQKAKAAKGSGDQPSQQ